MSRGGETHRLLRRLVRENSSSTSSTTRTMAAANWLLMAALLCLDLTLANGHSGETDTYHVSVGHLFLLRCPNPDAHHSNVTWSRGHLGLPGGVEVRDGSLWFLPVQIAHNGTYTCEKWGAKGVWRMEFGVSVSSEGCPDPSETVSVTRGVSEGLPCKQKEIFRLNKTRNIRWMKDCVDPVDPSISVGGDGFMRLSAATERHAGKYTCVVDISYNGRKYTSARSIQLTIDNDTNSAVPYVVYPQKEVVVVEVGMREELKCKAYLGSSEDLLTSMFWTIDGNFVEFYEDYLGLNESWNYFPEQSRVFGQSTLSISKVQHHFLNVPIGCHITTPAGGEVGFVWLQEADHTPFYTGVALCLSASLLVLALAAAFLFFKVELMLAYRELSKHFAKQQAPDGKVYDAYVSVLHPDCLRSAAMASFALQVLPEQLEKQHGYSLYITGRDDCPGEAMHEAISATVRQCRRLIIILSPSENPPTDGDTEEEALSDNQNQLCYEQKVGLYDALTQKSTRVILVEVGGPVEYSGLSESLRYIKRKQGALKWKTPCLGSQRLSTLRKNRNFWKCMRYHMPSVPARRCQTHV